MGVERMAEPTYNVVLGPCPGCEAWQLDYTDAVAREFVELRFEHQYELGAEEPAFSTPVVDFSSFHAVVEDLLQEHLAQCPHLQVIVEQL
jgi:hypothetical protein